MNSKAVLALALSAVLFGCGPMDPKTTVLPSDISTWKADTKLEGAVKKLGEEDKRLLVAYSMRAGLGQAFGGEGIPQGTTIGSAIETQKAWEEAQRQAQAQQAALEAEVKQKQLESLKEMNSALTTSLMSLKYIPSDFQAQRIEDLFEIQIAFKNNTSEKMIGVRGTVVFKDVFGEIIKQINLSNDADIPAGQTVIYNGTFDYNQFMNEDTKLRNTDRSKLTFEWMPDTYLFDGGKKLTMPRVNG
ncbi:hypothetical protein VCX22_20585 [Aeromonas caviae]|uniref:hypothetical protein n=1 Tax=Aeromonas caviae TaxID=648 RepID=UPI002B24D9D7|nr:hypothetical protein [Aeromonas caviae]MEA9419810.1 hypothetical protein [Aeromonas caviae]